MAERRNKIEIIYDILKSIQDKGGAIKPTHLLYKSNLSHKRMVLYLGELKDKGMILEEQLKDRNIIKLENKGYEFLEKYKQVMAFTEAFGL